jgi:hypothetical protein
MLNSLSALEILSFFNLVGIPCQSTIGEYPDPYRYNVNTIFSGHYCSLSDIIAHFEIQGENKAPLRVPGYKDDLGRIDNVIPILPPSLFQFIYKNAPKVLEFYASVGMRRIIAAIPGTLPATMTAALTKMMKMVTVEPTEVNIRAIVDLYHGTKAVASLKYLQPQFDELCHAVGQVDGRLPAHVPAKAKANTEGAVSDNDLVKLGSEDQGVDLTQNCLPTITRGFGELVLPLLTLYRLSAANSNEAAKKASVIFTTSMQNYVHQEEGIAEGDYLPQIAQITKALPAILRALYAAESWTACRSVYNGKADKVQIIRDTYRNLIGYDEDNWSPPLTDILVPDIEFDPAIHEPPTGTVKSFYEAKQFFDLRSKLNKLNILFALPAFGSFFAEVETGKSIDELVNIAQTKIPTILSSLETVNQLSEQQQYQNPTPGAWRDHDMSDDEEEGQQAQSEEYLGYVARRKDAAYDANRALLSILPSAFFGLDATTAVKATQKHLDHVKLINILSAFTHPESADRFPQTDPNFAHLPTKSPEFELKVSVLKDYPYDPVAITECPILKSQADHCHVLYKKLYTDAIALKLRNLQEELGMKYCQALINATTIDPFVKLLREGVDFGPTMKYSFDSKGHQDPMFHTFWNMLVNKGIKNKTGADKSKVQSDEDGVEIPLHLEKLRIVILGVTRSDEVVWNHGRVLRHYSLQHASQIFYDAKERDQWIEIAKLHAEGAKLWEYRACDTPNRHYHHKSRPSYFALGYETLLEYKNAVPHEEFMAYCDEHWFCCGLSTSVKRPTWYKIGQTRSVDDYKDQPKRQPRDLDAAPAADQDDDDDDDDMGDLF